VWDRIGMGWDGDRDFVIEILFMNDLFCGYLFDLLYVKVMLPSYLME